MTASGGGGEFEAFRGQRLGPLLAWLAAQGASSADAQDIAQTAFVQVWRRWPALRNPGGYLHRVAANELIRLWKAGRPAAACDIGRRADQQIADGMPGELQAGLVRQHLLTLPPRQRLVMAGCYDGCHDLELAGALDTPAATIRSNRRHARAALRALVAGDGPDLRGRVAHQAYAEMRGGNLSPAGSRPVISLSWARSARYRVDAEHGSLAGPLNPDELGFRRGTSPLRAVLPGICASLAEPVSAPGWMIVVVDAGCCVLWRAGERSALRRADRDGHSDGATLDEQRLGTSGVSLALAAGHPVLVHGPEHYVQALHDLACAAAPVRHPRDGRLLGALNLTTPLRAAHPGMLRLIDEMARRVERQLADLHNSRPQGP